MRENKKVIDLRSDTVTRPSQEMRAVMAQAEVGDDVYGDDPSVNQLESYTAELVGTEAALFTSSGTQSNLLALLTLCQRGDEYIAGQQAHCYLYEAGGAAVLGGIQPQPIEAEPDGSLNLKKVKELIKDDDFHYARTKLLCLENTHSGIVLSMDYLDRATAFVRHHGLKLHCDGARIFNAAIKLQVPVNQICQGFDSVSICLSKGLGAPVGSLLCGDSDFIAKARRWRKMLGGGMRQAGILAAAGRYALTHNIDRLTQDHENARILATHMKELQIPDMIIDYTQTNMVFVTLPDSEYSPLIQYLLEQGILLDKEKIIRLVTHLDVTTEDILMVVEKFKNYFTHY